jgi:hypothetical protein
MGVEPREDLTDDVRPWRRHVTDSIEDYMPLLIGCGAQQSEQRFLLQVDEKQEIVMPVDHQRGDAQARREADRIERALERRQYDGPAVNASACRTLIATRWSRRLSRASCTTPMPPSPSLEIMV